MILHEVGDVTRLMVLFNRSRLRSGLDWYRNDRADDPVLKMMTPVRRPTKFLVVHSNWWGPSQVYRYVRRRFMRSFHLTVYSGWCQAKNVDALTGNMLTSTFWTSCQISPNLKERHLMFFKRYTSILPLVQKIWKISVSQHVNMLTSTSRCFLLQLLSLTVDIRLTSTGRQATGEKARVPALLDSAGGVLHSGWHSVDACNWPGTKKLLHSKSLIDSDLCAKPTT